jgi:hypothetical protein
MPGKTHGGLFLHAAPVRCIAHAGLPGHFRKNDDADITAFFIPWVGMGREGCLNQDFQDYGR